MVLLALVAGVAGTAVGFVKARNEAETARRVSELLVGVFGDLDPEAQLGQISSVSGMLDRGVERIQNGLTDQPLVRARLLSTVGNAYRNMGRFDEAMPLLVEALEIREEHLGVAHSDVADSCVSLGWLEYWGADYEAARGSSSGQQGFTSRRWARTTGLSLRVSAFRVVPVCGLANTRPRVRRSSAPWRFFVQVVWKTIRSLSTRPGPTPQC